MEINNTTDQLAFQVAEKLRESQLLLTSAESCTGGLVAAAITAIAGSSNWFDCGFVTYSIPSKIKMLGVAAELIEQHGAVSEPVACAMAEGALQHSQAQIAVAITGIAGPSNGGEDKPVGTICFAWRYQDQTHCETVQFKGDRQQVRMQAVEHALQGVLTWLESAI